MTAELPALPLMCDAVVRIKIGEPLTDCRIVHKGSHEISFSIREGYGILKERLKRLFVGDTAVIWPENAGIHIKATVNARQHEYKRLPEDEQQFAGVLKAVWTRFRQQGKRVPLFSYGKPVKKSNPIHRATASRIAQATQAINELLQSENRDPPGPASIAYWATMQARQQDSAPIVQPDNETFRQLNFIDRQAQQHRNELSAATATTANPTLRIHIRLNGVEVPIDLNIYELRQALGLPGYNLSPPFRSRIIPATAEPHDVADDDHAEEKENGGSDENEEANAEAKEDHNSREGTLV